MDLEGTGKLEHMHREGNQNIAIRMGYMVKANVSENELTTEVTRMCVCVCVCVCVNFLTEADYMHTHTHIT